MNTGWTSNVLRDVLQQLRARDLTRDGRHARELREVLHGAEVGAHFVRQPRLTAKLRDQVDRLGLNLLPTRSASLLLLRHQQRLTQVGDPRSQVVLLKETPTKGLSGLLKINLEHTTAAHLLIVVHIADLTAFSSSATHLESRSRSFIPIDVVNAISLVVVSK